jgi:hypothetical protein
VAERAGRGRAPAPLCLRSAVQTGAYVARSELWDGLETAFRSDYLYDVGGRFVIDLLGALWKFEWIGLGGGYF